MPAEGEEGEEGDGREAEREGEEEEEEEEVTMVMGRSVTLEFGEIQKKKCKTADGWMDRWTQGWTDTLMSERIDGWM